TPACAGLRWASRSKYLVEKVCTSATAKIAAAAHCSAVASMASASGGSGLGVHRDGQIDCGIVDPDQAGLTGFLVYLVLPRGPDSIRASPTVLCGLPRMAATVHAGVPRGQPAVLSR